MLDRVGRLDYPDLEIDMVVTSDIEERVRLHSCEKEREMVQFCEDMELGSVFWDVGSNVGAYSLLAASLGVNVVAIEPALPNALQVLRNATLNGLSIQVLAVALGRSDGILGLNTTSLEAGATHGSRYQDADKVPVLTLTAATLVRLGVPAPDHCKVDVDGSELSIVSGFRDLVAEGKGPKSWMIEVDNDSRGPVHELIMGWGYRFVEAFPRSEPGVSNNLYER